MQLPRRTAKKGARTYAVKAKRARKTTKGARKAVKGWAIYKAVQKLAPKRLALAVGGIAAAGVAAKRMRKRSGAAAEPYGPLASVPAAAPSSPPAQEETAALEETGVNEGTPPHEATEVPSTGA